MPAFRLSKEVRVPGITAILIRPPWKVIGSTDPAKLDAMNVRSYLK